MRYRPYTEIVQSSRYDFRDLPSEFTNRKSFVVLGHYHDAIESARFRTVDSVVVLPAEAWERQQTQVTLFTFGSFRSVFRTIEAMSQILADQYLEHGILPIIQPITSTALVKAKHESEVLRRRISRSGLLLLEGLQSDQRPRNTNEG